MVGAIMDKFDGLGPDAKAKVQKAKAKRARGKALAKAQTETETKTKIDAESTDEKGNTNTVTSGDNVPFDEKESQNSSSTQRVSSPPPRMHQILQLDDREPHIVKYDVTKKERQKLDMHTDKSEWTFLIALSNGCGLDYEGGGTYFECLDATVHIQKGHALVFLESSATRVRPFTTVCAFCWWDFWSTRERRQVPWHPTRPGIRCPPAVRLPP